MGPCPGTACCCSTPPRCTSGPSTACPSRSRRRTARRSTRCAGCSTWWRGWSPTTRPTRLVACWDDDWRPAFRVAADAVVQGAPRGRPGGRGRGGARHPRRPQVPVIVDGAGGARHRPAWGRPGSRRTTSSAPWPRRAAVPRRHRHRRPRPVPARRRLARRSGCSTPAEGVAPRSRSIDEAAVAGAVRRSPGCSYADFAALRGDPSDGLPGVTGVGEKTAARSRARYGDLAGGRRGGRGRARATRRCARWSGAKLLAAADYLAVAPRVVRVRPRRAACRPATTALPAGARRPGGAGRAGRPLGRRGGRSTRVLAAVAGLRRGSDRRTSTATTPRAHGVDRRPCGALPSASAPSLRRRRPI